NGPTAKGRDDGLRLHDCIITSAIRCAPPANKPTPRQIRNCYPYLSAEFDALPRLQIIIALGSIGFKAALGLLADKGFQFSTSRPKFGHGAQACASNGKRKIALISSFHPSQQNTNTGKLTIAMFDTIFEQAKKLLV
ncbi:MAG: uracil-DNA glycosylase, partial [Candidatus Eremiobacteraeota bacterium]|nr:uracil-DNA glycosylase [Candidatus Eremiobacteraeota bacterium]